MLLNFSCILNKRHTKILDIHSLGFVKFICSIILLLWKLLGASFAPLCDTGIETGLGVLLSVLIVLTDTSGKSGWVGLFPASLDFILAYLVHRHT